MGFLGRLFWARRRSRAQRDLVRFTDGLNKSDPSEVGLVVAQATDVRQQILEAWGVDLAYPAAAGLIIPGLGGRLLESIYELQRKGDMSSLARAAAFMVWLHSVRALNDIKLRPLGREMWAALSRGFPEVEDAAWRYFSLTGTVLDTTDFDRVADGLGPTT